MRIEAANATGDVIQEVEAIGHLVWVLSYQGNVTEANQFVTRLKEAVDPVSLPLGILFMTQLAMGIYYIARDKFDAAQKVWEDSLTTTRNLEAFEYISNLQWLATARYRKGDVLEAQRLFQEALDEALCISAPGHVIFNRLQLASIAIDLQNKEDAIGFIEHCASQSEHQTRTDQATIYWLRGRLHTLCGDLPAARASFTEAIDLFERLGMRRELAEARQALADLDAGAAASPAAAPAPDVSTASAEGIGARLR